MTNSPPAHHRALIATVFSLNFLVALDMSLVNIALPSIQADLGFTASGLQWVVTAYLLTFAGFMLLGGRLGDLWGRRSVIIGGLVVFGIASVVGGFATSAGVLVGARALQGLAGALLAPAALALVTTLTDPVLHKRAMGVWAGAGAAGGAVGVVFSGLLTDWFSWRAVLLVNVPIVLIALFAAVRSVPADRDGGVGRLDIAGAILVTAGVSGIVYGVSSAGDYGWTSVRCLAGLGASVVLLAAFAAVERSTAHPLMPLALLVRRNILGANVFGFMLAAGQLAAFYFASLYVQTVWNVDPAVAGSLFIPFSFSAIVGVVLAPKLAARVGQRNALALCGLVAAAGLWLFSRVPSTYDFWFGILLPSVICAIGVGGAMVLVGAVATEGIAPSQAGIASGIVNSARQLGGTIGLAILVTLAGRFDVPRDGFRLGFAAGAVFLIVGSLVAWVILPARDRDRPAVTLDA